MDRLERRISLFEQGSTDALWPELAKVKQQAKAQARTRTTTPDQAGKAHIASTGKAPPLDSKETRRERGARMGR